MRPYHVLSCLIILAAYSCKKDEGKGGNSSITGQVMVKEYSDASFGSIYAEHNGYDETVFIIYGDEAGVGDKTDTGPDGRFEFKFLREGTYKVFVYSKDSTGDPFYVPDTAIVKTLEITDKKQTVDAGIFTIKKILN
jgi:hypothetical protein